MIPVPNIFFPVYIPNNVSVAARLQANTTTKTGVIAIWLCQIPSYPFICGNVTTYGDDTANSRGTSVTPASGSFGSWTPIGTPTDSHKFWVVGIGKIILMLVGRIAVMIM